MRETDVIPKGIVQKQLSNFESPKNEFTPSPFVRSATVLTPTRTSHKRLTMSECNYESHLMTKTGVAPNWDQLSAARLSLGPGLLPRLNSSGFKSPGFKSPGFKGPRLKLEVELDNATDRVASGGSSCAGFHTTRTIISYEDDTAHARYRTAVFERDPSLNRGAYSARDTYPSRENTWPEKPGLLAREPHRSARIGAAAISISTGQPVSRQSCGNPSLLTLPRTGSDDLHNGIRQDELKYSLRAEVQKELQHQVQHEAQHEVQNTRGAVQSEDSDVPPVPQLVRRATLGVHDRFRTCGISVVATSLRGLVPAPRQSTVSKGESSHHTSAAPHRPGAVPDQPDAVPDHSGAVPDQAGAVPDHSADVPVQPDAVPEDRGAVPDHSADVPVQPDAVPDHSGAVPEQPGAVPEEPGAVPEQPGAVRHELGLEKRFLGNAPDNVVPQDLRIVDYKTADNVVAQDICVAGCKESGVSVRKSSRPGGGLNEKNVLSEMEPTSESHPDSEKGKVLDLGDDRVSWSSRSTCCPQTLRMMLSTPTHKNYNEPLDRQPKEDPEQFFLTRRLHKTSAIIERQPREQWAVPGCLVPGWLVAALVGFLVTTVLRWFQ
ncbi:putative transmembrane protein [Gregarina niphandrodes]|uniref:Transmembrane protein n=1 Tax=Gregarina niphandrodes TaxID=110365 RepID=A0A023BAW0_GRENI|nr:putative transmembrane protein [Gregarina niphandrodes]EZG78469.1 putative transmembrane protein [Gregarina niphandrodes]|eukprot:XP_011129284.1 putative transmembrane protein [Gregarina niphandrodes]